MRGVHLCGPVLGNDEKENQVHMAHCLSLTPSSGISWRLVIYIRQSKMTRTTRRRRRKETGQEPKGGWVCCHVVVARLFLTMIMGEKRGAGGGGGGGGEGDKSTTRTDQETDRFRGRNASCTATHRYQSEADHSKTPKQESRPRITLRPYKTSRLP